MIKRSGCGHKLVIYIFFFLSSGSQPLALSLTYLFKCLAMRRNLKLSPYQQSYNYNKDSSGNRAAN